MKILKEISEFIDEVLLLELSTPIRGSDGETIGPANEQAYVLAGRTQWLKKRCEELEGKIKDLGDRKFVASVNKETGDLTITVESLGAAPKVHNHKPSDIETDASANFVSDTEKKNWSGKQDLLVSGENIKTVLGISLLGEGDIKIQSADIIESESKRFISNDEASNWDSKQTALKSGENIVTLHGKSLLGEGNITLTPSDVKADPQGAGTQAVADHVSSQDPHAQYLNTDRADERYVNKAQGNVPGGFLQLDDGGHIPADIAKLYEVRYTIVSNKQERLGLEENLNVTICLQLDENKIYYLDAGKDPSDTSNWKKGRSTDVSDVISVFGRSGVIVAEPGDYNADQITETPGKLFTSPTEKRKWNAKQDLLESGKNIKTFNGKSILGAGDVEITPKTIGAAEEQHTHSAADINETDDRLFVSPTEKKKWDDKQESLTSGKNIKTVNNNSLVGEGNVSITPDSIGAAKVGHEHDPSDIKTSDEAGFVSKKEKDAWNNKQDELISGDNIKSVGGESVVGSGNLQITPAMISSTSEAGFVSDTERQEWSGKQEELVSGKNIKTIFGRSLVGPGNVTIDSSDVGADVAGTAERLLKDHLAEDDPHPQYLNMDRAKETFVSSDLGNRPDGYLKLDSKGLIPSDIATLYEVRYTIVDNEKERLALPEHKNVTICLQSDENLIHYLDGYTDPSVSDNWKKGRSTDVSDVISVFGRSGMISAENGDYNADQITETDRRKFVTPAEKLEWSGKQNKLVSTETIRSINGNTILGSGDLQITAKMVGAAPTVHGHSADDIEETTERQFVSKEDKQKWNSQQVALVSGKNLKSINGTTLLGEGDVEITPEGIGAAKKSHKHLTSDIETDENAQFVSSAEKKAWTEKQSKLVSGQSIKSINEESILGEGDIQITAESLGAAPKEHTHTPAEIKTDKDAQFVSATEKKSWSAKQEELKSGENIRTLFGLDVLGEGDIKLEDIENLREFALGLVEAGEGIKISLDPDTNKIVITNTQESGDDGSGTIDTGKWFSKRVLAAKAGQDYSYFVGAALMSKDVDLYVLQHENVSPASVTKVDYSEVKDDIVTTTGFEFSPTNQKLLSKPVEEIVLGNASDGVYKADPKIDYSGTGFSINSATSSIRLLADWTGSNDKYTPFAYSVYNKDYGPECAFKRELTSDEKGDLDKGDYYSSDFKKLSERPVFLGVKLERAEVVSGYELQLYSKYALGANMADMTGWELQGTNEDITTGNENVWTTIDERTGEKLRVDNPSGWKTYMLDTEKVGHYKSYRILVKDCADRSGVGANTSNKYIGIPRLKLLTPTKMILKDGSGNCYTVNEPGVLTKVDVTYAADIGIHGFTNSGVIEKENIPSGESLVVLGNSSMSISVESYRTAPEITIHYPMMENVLDWSALEYIKPRSYYTIHDGRRIMAAATVDGKTYYAFNDGKWESLGELKVDETTAEMLATKGMTVSSMSGLSTSDWKGLFDVIPETDDPVIGIAYAAMITAKSDSGRPKSMNISLGDVIYRKKVDTDVVGITLTKKSIVFTPVIDGDFRFGYKFNEA